MSQTVHERISRAVQREQLERVQLFRGVDLDGVWHLLEGCAVRRLPADEVLIAIGDVDRCGYILLEGQLRVHLGPLTEPVVATIEPGRAVGEMAVLDHQPRSATIVAAVDSSVLELEETVFWSLLGRSHAFSLNVLGNLCERLRGVNMTLNESRRLQQQFEKQASIDALTAVGNRRWLFDVLPRQMKRNTMQSEELSIVMIDVDHFKRFNDNFGHSAGDFVLFAVAQILKARFRPTDLVARYGGEEFAVILPGTPSEGGRCAAERVRQVVSGTPLIAPDDTVLPAVTISAGVAQMAGDLSPEAFISRADRALYRAKAEGRNRVCVAEDPPVGGSAAPERGA